MVSRYTKLTEFIGICQPKSIIEIGTWNGNRAIVLASEALKHQNHVHYTGFDLFETGDEETNKLEYNPKENHSLNSVAKRLNQFSTENHCFTFELIKGNTRETLKKTRIADFAFIDGGHSIETIQNEYNALKECPIVDLDDYYEPNADGVGHDTSKFGCNKVVKDLKYKLFDHRDQVKGKYGYVTMAIIENGGKTNA